MSETSGFSPDLRSRAASFAELRKQLTAIPVIDTHAHSTRLGPRYTDPVQVMVGEYVTDLGSATSDEETRVLLDTSISLDERRPVLQRAWTRAEQTGFAQITRRVLHHFYGEDEVTLAALQRMQGKLLDLADAQAFYGHCALRSDRHELRKPDAGGVNCARMAL